MLLQFMRVKTNKIHILCRNYSACSVIFVISAIVTSFFLTDNVTESVVVDQRLAVERWRCVSTNWSVRNLPRHGQSY